MPEITFHHPDGRKTVLSAATGQSLMRVAVDNGITEIIAECGGSCACGTCHCHIDAAWFAKLPAPNDNEAMMLEYVAAPDDRSRLSCQIQITDQLDGLESHLPATQY